MDRWRIAQQSLSLPTPLLAPLNDYINLCNTGKQLQPTCNIFDKFPDLIIQGTNTTQINYDLGLKFMQILILFVFFFLVCFRWNVLQLFKDVRSKEDDEKLHEGLQRLFQSQVMRD